MTHTRDSSRAIAYARARRSAQRWIDSYRPAGTLYPAVCRRCHATHWQGRWRWDDAPPDLAPVLCPACERMQDRVPAHVVELRGALPRWWGEVQGLIANVEHLETEQHPLERVMRVEVGDDRVLVSTTGMHMARQLVAAIVRRFRHRVRLTFTDVMTSIEWLEPAEPRAGKA
ncbi:MAG TPA: BCAM0308 family protein [Planctomycetota bacterium]|nr:BCAM0308 family protein [Planctomycetota bacterium]